MHHLLEQLEQAGQAQAELQSRYSALEQKHKTEIEEKTSHILNLDKASISRGSMAAYNQE